jgi:hypothetical protein
VVAEFWNPQLPVDPAGQPDALAPAINGGVWSGTGVSRLKTAGRLLSASSGMAQAAEAATESVRLVRDKSIMLWLRL